MDTPSTKHQRLVKNLTYLIEDYIRHNKGACEVFPAPFAVFLNADNELYLEPDISVVCDQDKITDEGCKGTPDWIIEVVSPSSHPMDYNKKLFKYRTANVREYWIVDPDKNRIMVYNFEQDFVKEYSFSDQIQVGIYKDFEIDFSKITIG